MFTTPDNNWLIATTIIQPDLYTLEDESLFDAIWGNNIAIQSKARFWKIHPGGYLSKHEVSEMFRGWFLAVSPDVRRIACVDIPLYNDGSVRILETRTGIETFRLRNSHGSIGAAVFSPNGRQIGTSHLSGRIVLWGPPMT